MLWLGVAAGLVCLGAVPPASAADEGRQYFENKVRPLLVAHCYECHSAKAKELGGKLRLDSRAGILEGGESGPALIPGKPGESLLIDALRREDEHRMPPDEPLLKIAARDGLNELNGKTIFLTNPLNLFKGTARSLQHSRKRAKLA